MTTFLLIFLIVADIGLVYAIFMVSKKQTTQSDILRDLTEERILLTELRTSIKEELDQARRSSKATISKVAKIAAEAEHEVKNQGETFASSIGGIVSELTSHLDKPLEEITKKQLALEAVFKRVDREKASLIKVLSRAESLVEYFESGASQKDLLNEIEEKRYQDARELLAKGVPTIQVSEEVGLPVTEVRLLEGVY